MDDADISEERMQRELDAGISRIRKAASLKPIGYCFFCNESVGNGRIFCDSGCREDYELEQAQLKRSGRTDI